MFASVLALYVLPKTPFLPVQDLLQFPKVFRGDVEEFAPAPSLPGFFLRFFAARVLESASTHMACFHSCRPWSHSLYPSGPSFPLACEDCQYNDGDTLDQEKSEKRGRNGGEKRVEKER